MGALFEQLCRGPVIVIDDGIGQEGLINQLIEQLVAANLPILPYTSVALARRHLSRINSANFVVLDWLFTNRNGAPSEVQIGAEIETSSEDDVISFIKEIREVCLAPIFLLSAHDIKTIKEKLKSSGIETGDNRCVFVEDKTALCRNKGALISKIEEWIKGSPHVYLTKWWINEWLSKNAKILWELYATFPDWPRRFYHSFIEDGAEPLSELRDTLTQLVSSAVDITTIQEDNLKQAPGDTTEENLDALKRLYERLVYARNDIDSDLRPGDVFAKKMNGKKIYYLNIRPECDTTKRGNDDPILYLLRGTKKKPSEIKDRYDPKRGIIDHQDEIILLQLDGNSLVRFEKKELQLLRLSELANYGKVCRIVPPFITHIRQSFLSYLGRFGVPRYSKDIVDSLFPKDITDGASDTDSPTLKAQARNQAGALTHEGAKSDNKRSASRKPGKEAEAKTRSAKRTSVSSAPQHGKRSDSKKTPSVRGNVSRE